MSQKNYRTAKFADVSLLSALYAKISVFGEQMDKLNSRVNQIFGMVKRINTRLEDLAGSSDSTKGKKMWFPEKSFYRYEVDFDLLIESIEELNKLIRFEEQHIKHTPTGASFKLVEHIPLTLYEDGLVISDGSLQPYSENKTKKIIEDLMDGYFPAELQHQYPEGVFFQVSDRRTELQRKCNTHEIKTTPRVEGVSLPSANPDKLLHKDSPTDVAFEGFPLLQTKFPRGKNEINVKILSHNGKFYLSIIKLDINSIIQITLSTSIRRQSMYSSTIINRDKGWLSLETISKWRKCKIAQWVPDEAPY
ncbi:UBX domain-containing protein 11-like isoform X1 [Ischnura elegans]|uniref:UBX domain-containing protein 11-like isoform X1 n=1 Tax=Ischnura elegans TaxID=197161 RepID=UPI001ED8A243|nr:UBX domain-containing protein 11-like isoform X1 [Ischnura elegans]